MTQTTDCRAEFEKWAEAAGFDITRYDIGCYGVPTQQAWAAYQAAWNQTEKLREESERNIYNRGVVDGYAEMLALREAVIVLEDTNLPVVGDIVTNLGIQFWRVEELRGVSGNKLIFNGGKNYAYAGEVKIIRRNNKPVLYKSELGEMMSNVYNRLAKRIIQMRNDMEITQSELASYCNLSRSTIANIETGRQAVTLEQLEDIAHAFGTGPKILLKGIWL